MFEDVTRYKEGMERLGSCRNTAVGGGAGVLMVEVKVATETKKLKEGTEMEHKADCVV